ncbi:MAG TPA: methyltransferase domain-containing protein [Vicinamibacteria bacterium]|nr:methyltransferase domain-containing protein [Vicinamibacteria bacterium]
MNQRPRNGQDWDPGHYQRHASFVAELGRPVVDLLAPRAGERVLDLGCGDGRLTEALVAAGCAVVGVDSSAEQVAAARARGLDARVMDGQALDFDGEFDAVFSNAALHWMTEPHRVLDGVWRALRPGGRFVGEFGARGNVAAVSAALARALSRRGLRFEDLDPWNYPAGDEYRRALETVGFTVHSLATFARPTTLPGDVLGWLETFARSFLAPLPAAEREPFCREVAATLAPTLRRPDGRWFVDYVRLRFAARKPAGTRP